MKTLIEKFTERYIPEPMSGCWLWLGPFFANGYGYVTNTGKNRRANRVSYELHKGTIPSGQVVRHICDNKACVNPDHLLVGTNQDNADDAVRRDRVAFGKTAGRTKLTEDQVREIRRRRANGELLKVLAAEFGITHAQVRCIQFRHSWRRLM